MLPGRPVRGNPAFGINHHGKAIGRAKWKRRDARGERRRDKIAVRASTETGDAGPVQPMHTHRKAPRRSETK